MSVLPNQNTINRFSERLGFDFNKECFLKIRLYSSYISKKKESYEIRVVPMVVLNKLSKKNIDILFDNLLEVNDFCNLGEKFVSSKSKLRLLQFYLSVKLSELWFEDISYILEPSRYESLKFSERNLSFLFPKSVIKDVELICKNSCVFNFINTRTIEEVSVAQTNKIIDPIMLKVKLTQPFLNMYYDKEILCRELVKGLGKNVFLNDKYEELSQRLEHGITFAALKRMASPYSDICDVDTTVSLFIDQAVDVGIAVPIIEEDYVNLTRAYRHGEDVLFGKREEILYTEMLYRFQEASNKQNGLTHTSVEKMIVLFTKIGFAKNILKPYISNFTLNPRDNNGELCNILRVKASSTGAVGLCGTVEELRKNRNIPFVTDESKSMWLTEIFKFMGYIKLNENDLYSIEEPDTSSVLTDYLLETQIFSYLFGELFDDACDTGINFCDEDIDIICSCISLPTTIQSIAAEIQVFMSSWCNISLTGKNMTSDKKRLDEFKTQLFSKCISDAYMMVNAYDQKKVEQLIESVSFKRKTDQNIWRSYFTSNVVFDISDVDDVSLKNDVINLYNEQRLWVFVVKICVDLKYCSMLNNFSCMYNAERTSEIEDKILEVYECLTKLKDKCRMLNHAYGIKFERLNNICISIINKIQKGILVEVEEINFLMDIVISVNKRSRFLLDKSCTLIGQHGKVNSFDIYSHCISIGFKYADSRDMYYKIEKIKQCLQKFLSTEGVMVLHENYSPNFYTDANIKQVWIIAKQTTKLEYLTKICLKVLYALRENIKIIMFHDIGYPNAIKVSERTTPELICGSFYDYIEAFHESSFLEINQESKFMYCVAKNRYKHHKFKTMFKNINANNWYDLVSDENILNSEQAPFVCLTYQMKNIDEMDGGLKMNKKNIGIITVLAEETKAAVEVLKLTKLPNKIGQRAFYEGQLDGENVVHTVVLTQQLNQGEESVISAYNALVNKYSPDIVFLVGIAGGIHDEVNYCDVVIADETIGYDKRKDMPGKIKRRGCVHKIDAKLKPIIQSFEQTVMDKPIVASQNSKFDEINIFHEHIGSGNAVIANELSEIREWLHEYNDKIYAVEMEAFGISTAFYESVVDETPTVCGVCIIRGISDLADVQKKETTEYRIPAACNAAIVLKEFVKHLPSF